MNTSLHFGEHYNARGLSPELIADSFVASSQFTQVAALSNCVLVGPRGSGKTTLLRMLDPRALYRWEERTQHDEWSAPNFVGIFVPIDTAWVSALENAVDPKTIGLEQSIYLGVYSLSIARALVDVMRWRLSDASLSTSDLHVNPSRVSDETLARHLGALWFPNSTVRSMLELRLLLSSKIAALPAEWHATEPHLRVALVSAYLNPLALTAAACDLFNVLADEPARRWALLCDELEIAPLVVQQLLFAGLRAAPQPLILKLALTPKERIPLLNSSEQPLPANDYEIVSLSYPTREEGAPEKEREDFCIAIWKSLVAERSRGDDVELENPFKAFESPVRRAGKRSAVISKTDLDARFGEMFRELTAKDGSFREYLEAKGVDASDLNASTQSQRDAVIRKVRPIVEVRNYYLRKDAEGRLVRAPRRSPLLYCGAKRIFAVSEGHPRWLKYTLAAMLARARDTSPRIKVPDQNRELLYSVQRVDARLRALSSVQMSAEELIHRAGDYFAEQVLGQVFKADPVLSFVVDKGVPSDVILCLEKALYIGALVPLQKDVFNLFTKGLEGRRFRLSNWLAPMFNLPLMTGKATNLSTILSVQRIEPDRTEMQASLGLE